MNDEPVDPLWPRDCGYCGDPVSYGQVVWVDIAGEELAFYCCEDCRRYATWQVGVLGV